jgi:outer membrane assembly lipoprotein YfiO
MKRLLSPAKSFASIGVCGLVGAFLLAGCSKKPKDIKGDCRERYEKIHARFEKGRYSYAKQGYGDFIVTCAGTEHVEQAHYELSESHFRLKEWMEAEQEFSAFLRDYPTSRRYAQTARWRLARAMSKQVQIPQRDQTKTLEAMREMETFAAEFPEAPEADSARAELGELSQRLADRDMLVARLYTRMNEPLAAVIYYKHLLSEYGDRVPRREINLLLAESYVKLNQFIEAENVLIQFDGVAQDDPFAKKIAAARHKLEKAKLRYERQKRKEQGQAAVRDTSGAAVPGKTPTP